MGFGSIPLAPRHSPAPPPPLPPRLASCCSPSCLRLLPLRIRDGAGRLPASAGVRECCAAGAVWLAWAVARLGRVPGKRTNHPKPAASHQSPPAWAKPAGGWSRCGAGLGEGKVQAGNDLSGLGRAGCRGRHAARHGLLQPIRTHGLQFTPTQPRACAVGHLPPSLVGPCRPYNHRGQSVGPSRPHCLRFQNSPPSALENLGTGGAGAENLCMPHRYNRNLL